MSPPKDTKVILLLDFGGYRAEYTLKRKSLLPSGARTWGL